MGQSRHPWKTSNMLLLAILLLGVGIQAAPQVILPGKNYESSYQPKCSYQPKEECTTVYENVEREVTNEECQTVEECRVEYKLECHTEKCKEVGHPVCEKKPVCVNVVTKKTERVPRQRCNTVQKKVCY